MRKKFRFGLLLSVTSLAMACVPLLMAAEGISAATPRTREFKWPEETSLARGFGNVRYSKALRDRLQRTKFTDEEFRNVQITIDRTAGKYRGMPPEQWRSPLFQPNKQSGFYMLHAAFGYPVKNGYSERNFADRINHYEFVIAKDNRVAIIWRIVGTINGPMYGFEGRGQKVDMWELSDTTFDTDGKIIKSQPWSSEDLAFYAQLGGHVELPKASK